MKTITNSNNSQAAAGVLGEMAALTTLEGVEDGQKLHGATFEDADPVPDNPVQSVAEATLQSADLQKAGEDNGDFQDEKIAELLDQIGEGLQADDATNFEKLTIARKYGPMVRELKEIAPHGTYKKKLTERFPKASYHKCRRWKFIAEHEAEVAAAIEKYPDVKWGPKKMIDFLKESWTKESEDEIDWFAEDEEDCCGIIKDDYFESEPQETDDEPVDVIQFGTAAEAKSPSQSASHAVPAGATAGPVIQAVQTPPKPAKGNGTMSKKGNATTNKAETNTSIKPTVNRMEYEVEVRIGFKLSVPETITAEEVERAVRDVKNWNFGRQLPFENGISDVGVVVNHVKPWGDLGEYEPETIPE